MSMNDIIGNMYLMISGTYMGMVNKSNNIWKMGYYGNLYHSTVL